MVQSPSWAANWFAASQEILRISRNPKVHYRTHKRPPPVSTLGQTNPVHIPTSHLLEIHPNVIHPSTPRSPQWSLSLRFPHQESITPSPHPYALHAQPISFLKEQLYKKKSHTNVKQEERTFVVALSTAFSYSHNFSVSDVKNFVTWADIRLTAVGWQALIHAGRLSEKTFDHSFKLVLL